MMMPDLLKFLESRGFTLRLDGDGQLELGFPRKWRRLAREVLADDDLCRAIAWRLQLRRAQGRRQFVGGPLDGAPHQRCTPGLVTYHAGRGRWASYHVGSDLAARFVGWGTSRKKALRLGLHLLTVRPATTRPSPPAKTKGGDQPSNG